MVYRGIVKKRSAGMRAAYVAIAVILLAMDILIKKWIYVPFAFLVIIACFFEKEQILSEGGINTQYKLFGMTMDNIWTWDEVTALHTDYKRARPNVFLQIAKDIVIRGYVLDPADCREVLELAAEMNPRIKIVDIPE